MARRWLWTMLTWLLVRVRNRARPVPPASDLDRVQLLPLGEWLPGLADAGLNASAVIPRTERPALPERLFIRAFLALKEWLPLGTSDARPLRTVPDWHLPRSYARLVRPSPAATPRALVELVQRGTFSLLTEVDGDALVLRAPVDHLQPRSPYVPVGGVLRVRPAGRGWAVESIRVNNERFTPGDRDFGVAERRFLAGLGTYVTMVEHLAYVHLCTAGPFALSTHEALPARHPLRGLMQPFTREVVRLINTHVAGLVSSEASNMPQYSGYSLEQVNRVLVDGVRGFQLPWMNPVRRARRLGTLGLPGMVTVAAAVELYGAFEQLAQRFVGDAVGEIDDDVTAWVAMLDREVPGGVRTHLGAEAGRRPSPELVAELVATAAYTSSIGHFLVSAMTREAMLDMHFMPPAVTAGGDTTAGPALEKANSVMISSVLRHALVGAQLHNVPIAGQAAWTEFQDRLRAIQSAAETDPQGAFRIHPARAGSSAHS